MEIFNESEHEGLDVRRILDEDGDFLRPASIAALSLRSPAISS